MPSFMAIASAVLTLTRGANIYELVEPILRIDANGNVDRL